MNEDNSLKLLAIDTIVESINLSDLSDIFIVRGSYISRFYLGPYSRICQDLDLLYLGEYSSETIEREIKNVINKANNSKISFDPNSITFNPIWENSLAPGLRTEVLFIYNSKSYKLQIDISAGDPLASEPVSILVNPEKNLFTKTVSVEILAAWKLHGLFEVLNGAWHSKTLWDFYLLCKYNNLNIELFYKAINLAFESRFDPPEILKRLLYGDFGQSRTSRKSWINDITILSKNNIISLDEVLKEIRNYLIPILKFENDGSLLTQSDITTYRVEKLKLLNNKAAKQKLSTLKKKTKILAYNAYFSIPHLFNSRKGSSERSLDDYRESMLLDTQKNPDDIVIIQEKLDGSCVCAYRKNGYIYALGRDGRLSEESANEGLKLWADWVDLNRERFLSVLNEGERICGEWLALVHGTRYKLIHEPFVVFDLFDANDKQLTQKNLVERIKGSKFINAKVLHHGSPCNIEKAILLLGKNGFHGAIDHPEGMVWRLERDNKILFLAKYVFPNKIDGFYLPEISKTKALWNWYPSKNYE